MCKSKAVNIDNDLLVIGRSHSDTIKKISHPKNEVASLSFFHLRAIFYGANIGLYYITQKKRRYFFSHRNEFQDHFYPHTTKTLTSASHCSAANRALPEVRGRSGSGRSARRGPHGGTERHNRRAAPALVRATPFRPKKGGANDSGLGHFFDLSGSFSPIAPTASDTLADARSEVGETGE